MQNNPYGISASPARWVEEYGKNRLVVSGFQEDPQSITIYCDRCHEESWVWWRVQLFPIIQFFVDTVEAIWSWRLSFLAFVAAILYLTC